MSDIEKVISGLKAHADGCGYRSHHCDDMECPYRYGDESCDIDEMCRDALAILKKQEETINDLTETIRQLNQHIKDLSEYMTPYGKVKDVKAYAELLKEQEAVKPKKIKGFNQPCYVHYDFVCENCNTDLIHKQPYCAGCGKAVKWE